ncbi:MAG: GPR endopeptidase [Oscillospiraceae bacterium]|jgi:spore protease|nr:GPR endopeptidase [Oscillospiraceae bacterium]
MRIDNNIFMNRTDLALELVADGISHKEGVLDGLLLTETQLGENNPIGKPAGTYTTLHCAGLSRDEKAETGALTRVLAGLIPEAGRILVAGLGNANITPDSLGVRAASQIVATAHLSGSEEFADLGMREVYVVETGVSAQTGMESSRQLSFIADGIKPDMVVVIDSLACSAPERLGRTLQVTDTGIAPGSGVGNARCEVSRKTMGVPVVAVGVPTVVDLSSIAPEIGKNLESEAMVVPRDIDNMISHFAKVISKALNRVLIPTLTEEEVEKLKF